MCSSCGRYLGEVEVWPVHCVMECGNVMWRNDGPPTPPGVLRRGYNYVRAWARWAASGYPIRNDAEITRLRGVCGACELFNGSICTHKKCGCGVAEGHWWGDKLRWATEDCPIQKWDDGSGAI